MHTIRKHLVTDESLQPLAVQIDYADWLEVERLLKLQPVTGPNGAAADRAFDLNRFAGTLSLRDDPLSYQNRVRDEWP